MSADAAAAANAAAVAAATAALIPDARAYAAHFERDNQVLRQNAFQLRRVLEQREMECAQLTQALAVRNAEGERAERQIAEICLRRPDLAAQLWQVPEPQPTDPWAALGLPSPAGSPAGMMHLPAAAAASLDGLTTPGRQVLSLQQLTPGPAAASGPFAASPLAHPSHLFPGPCPTPPMASPAHGPSAWDGLLASPAPAASPSGLVATPCRLPSSAPPAQPAPGTLSPERKASNPPAADAAATLLPGAPGSVAAAELPAVSAAPGGAASAQG
eukprot:TRINITY_DN92117_c0_g1_i1.p1 TRINITY_DN92117_c0_g1~~TRINITY_DN92117_c0_g1_i1.p1  ORF type:complete len:272 (+),score=52.70 TRINITY_DN92117_c0_g1_i1:113-928(+)